MAVGGQYSQAELALLFDKAQVFNSTGETRPIAWFYRDKPQVYFNGLRVDGIKIIIMQTAEKDQNGDPRSPLNMNNCRGIFFSANINYLTELPYAPSLYGDQRLCVAPERLLNDGTSLYFTDFYCMNEGGPHYITLVIATDGTDEGTFCDKNLLKLNKKNNAFLCLTDVPLEGLPLESKWVYIRNTNILWIEVFYMHDLEISQEYHQIAHVEQKYEIPMGGRSGRIKIAHCQTCNIYENNANSHTVV